tara:strand:- start:9656 stop:10870 length:1215 start_codon:yes stop_codon:yes gene_type:complete
MSSNYTALGIQLMTTGEKAGTWGTLTNTNWDIIEQISGGYTTQAVTDGADTTLSVNDGTTGATLAHRVIELTGSLSAGRNVTIPLDVQTFYIIKNATTGSQVVTFKYVTGSGNSVAIANGATVIVYATANDGTNPDIDSVSLGDVTLTGTQTLTNKTLTSPIIGTSILDTGSNELFKLTATGSATNEFTVANAPNSSGPTLSSTGSSDTNIDININPAGSGVLKSGTAAVKIAGTETIFVPANAMFGTTTNGAEAAAVETTALRPELKVLDFDASTRENAQFSIAMPKSWNLGTVTYQVFWSPSNTNTGNCIFGVEGLACTEGDTADAVFGTAIEVTDAGIGTVEDVQMSAVSSAVTIGGSPADDDYCFFQLYRDAADGSDTFTGDARVMGIKLFYTTDAANDA